MKNSQQRRLNAMHAVRQFLDNHAAALGSVNQSDSRKRLDAALESVMALSIAQRVADREIVGLLQDEKVMVAELRYTHLRPVTAFMRTRRDKDAALAGMARADHRLRARQLARAATAVASVAAPHVDSFTSAGFPPDTLAQLALAAGSVQGIIDKRGNTLASRMGITQGIEAALREGRTAVAMLHAVISQRFAGDPVILEEWRVSRRVVRKPGPARGSTREGSMADT